MDLKSYFDKGLTYEEYVDLLGENLDLHQLHYSKFSTGPAEAARLKTAKPVNIMVLTEPWCGDSLAIFPVVRKIAEVNDWPIKLLRRDENPDLMDQFLTRNARAVPIFLFVDEEFSLIFRFGPRPKAAQDIFETHREEFRAGKIEKSEVIKKIRAFYSKDRGQAILGELMAIFEEKGILKD
jgi:thiol-disulfide isomerase/thioredoxin